MQHVLEQQVIVWMNIEDFLSILNTPQRMDVDGPRL